MVGGIERVEPRPLGGAATSTTSGQVKVSVPTRLDRIMLPR
jgi:hypothetical protein